MGSTGQNSGVVVIQLNNLAASGTINFTITDGASTFNLTGGGGLLINAGAQASSVGLLELNITSTSINATVGSSQITSLQIDIPVSSENTTVAGNYQIPLSSNGSIQVNGQGPTISGSNRTSPWNVNV
jgi:hypothetical protein